MTPKAKPGAKRPRNLDLKKIDSAAKKVIRENTEWLKEMANK